MADINIGSDALLTTILNDNDRVTITKADTGQQVATMKVADFKATIGGRDYSLLTEQVVPGEYWVGRDGVTKKQVYTRTFVFIAPATISESNILTLGIDSLFDVKVIFNYSITYKEAGSNFINFYEYAVSTPGGFVFRNLDAGRVNKTAVITAKYTKL